MGEIKQRFTKCPLCGEKIKTETYKRTTDSIRFHFCLVCPFVGFEFLNQGQINLANELITKKKEKTPEEKIKNKTIAIIIDMFIKAGKQASFANKAHKKIIEDIIKAFGESGAVDYVRDVLNIQGEYAPTISGIMDLQFKKDKILNFLNGK